MARIQPGELVITGARALVVAPSAAITAITPERWAAAPARLARMDRLCALTLVACDGALVDAALAPTAPEWHGERVAISLGTAYGCHATNEDYYRGLLREGPSGASPRLFAYTLPSSPVGEVSIHHGIRGPATALANGLTSGLDALADGLAHLTNGRADRVLACAADVATPLLARLLAADASGLHEAPVLVDGAAALLLERASDAASRGATPRARVLGTASAFRAGNRASALSTAIAQAMSEADITAGAVARVLAAPADAAVAHALGIAAADEDFAAGALGAATLVAVARAIAGGKDGLALACAGDDAGSAAAALVAIG